MNKPKLRKQSKKPLPKKIKYWLIKLILKYLGDDIMCYLADKEAEKHWYKARRLGYKKKDMGYYYSDLEMGKHTDFLGRFQY